MENMVVFDFSGTLSIGAILFGREENLVKELQQAGLWQIGLNSPEIFWNDVINPTWQQGATTAIGYKRLLAERLKPICHASEEKIFRCVAKFADRYFTSSSVHPAWSPIFHFLREQPATVVVIATDHYAEATGQILSQLEQLNIPGVSVSQATNGTYEGKIIVANSSDLGHMKSTHEFWQRVKASLALETLFQVMVIDDFGFNESSQDSYAAAEKITTRQNTIIDVLSKSFGCRIKTCPFLLQNKLSVHVETIMSEFHECVKKTETFIKENITYEYQCSINLVRCC